jgi:hypothetical protein
MDPEVEYLKDRLAIQDVVMRHARGVDRHDEELMNSCYWEDGVARYGPAVIPGPEYGAWSNGAHDGRFKLHSHNITTFNVTAFEGDVAYVESYVLAAFLSPDQKRASLVSGRYFDQITKRGGEWRIAVRRTVIDVAMEGDASFLGAFRGTEVPDDFWTTKDMSYLRPLDVETPVPGWHGP